jgi:hypothetical protein
MPLHNNVQVNSAQIEPHCKPDVAAGEKPFFSRAEPSQRRDNRLALMLSNVALDVIESEDIRRRVAISGRGVVFRMVAKRRSVD